LPLQKAALRHSFRSIDRSSFILPLASSPPIGRRARSCSCNMCEPGAACCLSAGDTAWVLTSATLVFIQTPAMGVAQAGMIRRKNSLSMLLQTMSGMMIGTVGAVCCPARL